jgi:hypothetical protein
MVSRLTVPLYTPAPARDNSFGIENEDQAKDALQQLLDELRTYTSNGLSSTAVKSLTLDTMMIDDSNALPLLLDFLTSCANLRCDNYTLRHTSPQECYEVIGKCKPTSICTLACASGLMMLELIKCVSVKKHQSSSSSSSSSDVTSQQVADIAKESERESVCEKEKEREGESRSVEFMNRMIALHTNVYVGFDVELPTILQTTSVKTVVSWDPETVEPKHDMVPRLAYPNPHTIWTKLDVSGSLTLSQFINWLSSEHHLQLKYWNFVLGYRREGNDVNDPITMMSVSAPVYPIMNRPLDYSLLPPLDLSLPLATRQLMNTKAAVPVQRYVQLWKDLKGQGFTTVPPQPPADPLDITEEMSLYELLQVMEQRARQALAEGRIHVATISHVDQRLFVVIPSGEALFCTDINSGEDVEHLCSFKIHLKESKECYSGL